MEQNQDLTPRQSLQIISEAMSRSRAAVLKQTGRHLILWGCLLVVVSLLVYILWKTTGSAAWNYLWFAMPVVGFPAAAVLRRRGDKGEAGSLVSRLVGNTWTLFAAFALSLSAITLVFGMAGAKGATLMGIALTPGIALLFGIAQSFSGVLLKNWVVVASGLVIGLGGALIYYACAANVQQALIFTFAGVVLALTGVSAVLKKNQ